MFFPLVETETYHYHELPVLGMAVGCFPLFTRSIYLILFVETCQNQSDKNLLKLSGINPPQSPTCWHQTPVPVPCTRGWPCRGVCVWVGVSFYRHKSCIEYILCTYLSQISLAVFFQVRAKLSVPGGHSQWHWLAVSSMVAWTLGLTTSATTVVFGWCAEGGVLV